MSATFKLGKKNKVSQDDLRRLMSEHKSKLPEKKINNPLAKYNDAGQLTCILCQTIVRSESVWQVHTNAKQHKDNIVAAKKLKEETNNFTVPPKTQAASKRSAGSSNGEPPRKIKGILKNANPQSVSVPSDFFDLGKSDVKISTPYPVMHHDEEVKRAPLKPQSSGTDVTVLAEGTEEEKFEIPIAPEQPIPEGFFDDPVLDAKVRNIEYKDPVEEEWERFQKEMREETSTSAAIIAGEQEEATAERQIDEIDEQIRNWSRVLDLELKKEETAKQKMDVQGMNADDNTNDSDSSSDMEEFLDWRSKKSFR